ncbi:MAG TPA: tetratricopeptide repeat protein [Kofleriaceae bacterium]|nr:tetratricopeptide repeat protein [Kofleriaceae bacterium]
MSRGRWPLWLLALALLSRLVFFVELRAAPTYEHPEGGDSILYDKIAAGAPEPARAYFHSPLYQWYLGGMYGAFGRDLTLVRAVQHLAGCLMVLLVWATTRELFGSRAIAAVAGAAMAVCGPLVFFEGQLLVDALMPLLVAAVPAALLLHARRPRAATAAAVGLTIAIAALARGVALIWAPVVAVWIWRGGGPGLRRTGHALAFAGAMALSIAPVTLRNYLVEGDLVAITANGGLNLYIGNHSQATGSYVLPAGLWFEPGDPTDDYAGFTAAARELGHRPSSGELSSWWSHKALDYVADHPARTAALAGTKLKLLINDFEYPQLYNYDGYRAICPILGLLPTAGWIVAPALVGLGLALGRRRRTHERLLAVIAVLFAASFIPFFVVDRFRCAWLPLLAPFAAAAMVELVVACRARRWAPAAALTVAMAASAAAVFAPIDGPTPAAQYFAFGEAEVAAGDLRAAIDWYEKAADADPRQPRVLANLGVTLARVGRFADAESALRRAADLWPGSDRVQNDLGRVYVQLGRPADAERAFRAAIQLNPGLGEAYANLGDLFLRRGEPTRAADAFRSALLLMPRGSPGQAAIAARLSSLTGG